MNLQQNVSMTGFKCLPSILVTWIFILIGPTQSFAAIPIDGTIAGESTYPYRLFLPAQPTESGQYPLVLFLAGLGGQGTDNLGQLRESIDGLVDATQNSQSFRAILVAPQSPSGWWDGEMVNQLVDDVIQQYPIDTNRLYVVGMSAGGGGVYVTISAQPERWAAGASLAGVPVFGEVLDRLVDVPLWLLHGMDDGTVRFQDSKNMFDILSDQGGYPRLTPIPDRGHDIWRDVYNDNPDFTGYYSGGDPEQTETGLYSWLFSRTTPRPREPVVGDRLLIDFGLPQFSEYGSSGYWNNPDFDSLNPPGSGSIDLAESNGNLRRARLRIRQPFSKAESTDETPQNSALPESVAKDFWISVPDGIARSRFEITGLEPLRGHKIEISPGMANAGETSLYWVNGAYCIQGEEGPGLSFESVFADNKGTLVFECVSLNSNIQCPIASLEIQVLEDSFEASSLVADCGQDQVIPYPMQTCVLGAFGGGISNEDSDWQYSWHLLEGPNSALIESSFEKQSNVVFTESGTYIFKLTVSDGHTFLTDTTRVDVKGAPLASIQLKSPEQGLILEDFSGPFQELPLVKPTSAIETIFGADFSTDNEVLAQGTLLFYSGYFSVGVTGEYILRLKSTSDSRLFVDDNLLMENIGAKRLRTIENKIDLREGFHAIRVEYLTGTGSHDLEVGIGASGSGMNVLTTQSLFYEADISDYQIVLDSSTIAENEELMTEIGNLSVVDVEKSSGFNYRLKEGDDSRFFRIVDDTLYSFSSFDYERKYQYNIVVVLEDVTTGQSVEKSMRIDVMDTRGKFDRNGIADAEIAAKYPQVNEGDFIFFNAAGSRTAIDYDASLLSGLSFPNKILIRGEAYEHVKLDLSHIKGESASQRILIGNFLGQVSTRMFHLINGEFWRCSGQYDAGLGIGSPYYSGCDKDGNSVAFGGSHGSYGIQISNRWANDNDILLYVGGAADGYEVDHIESGEGGFAGAMFKKDSGLVDMNNVYLHHLYIHDTGSEGIYLGSTQPDPQHQFNDLLIENCVILRAGCEALQIGQLGENCVVRNNVLWGAFDWLSPFNRYQDNVVQIGARQGGLIFEKNIVIGGGGQFMYFGIAPKDNIQPNGQPITLKDNFFWGNRGIMAAYQGASSDGVTSIVWEGNQFGYFDYDYDRAYKDSPRNYLVGVATNGIDVIFKNNTYDVPGRLLAGKLSGSVKIVEDQNLNKAVLPLSFQNLIGEPDDYPYLLWKRWTAEVGEDLDFPSAGTKKGEAVVYVPGEVVQWHHNGETRFYECIKENSYEEPTDEGNAFWRWLRWEINGQWSNIPPDDVQLVPGSKHTEMGVGVTLGFGTWSGYPIYNSNRDVFTDSFLGWINYSYNDWIWSYGLNSWLLCKADMVGPIGAWVYFPSKIIFDN